jgi:2-C-methyl-D-erythritol 4-phosphate cytidylyltransferase
VLTRAHENGADASDDAALVEALGARVVVVEGEVDNVKVTHLRDMDVLAIVERSRP